MKFTTYIVTRRNDGSPVSQAEQQTILNETWQRFGGWTKSGLQSGAWGDETGQMYADESFRLEVVCDRSQLPAAIEWVHEIGRRLDQKAMYFEVRDYDGVQILDVD